jgi:hypothetical protein
LCRDFLTTTLKLAIVDQGPELVGPPLQAEQERALADHGPDLE